MKISRVSTLSLAVAVAVFALGYANPAFAPPDPKPETKCNDGRDNDRDGLIDGKDPDCVNTGGGDSEQTIEYIAELTSVDPTNDPAAFEFGPVIVTLYHNTLRSTDDVEIVRPNPGNGSTDWNNVFAMPDVNLNRDCHLFGPEGGGVTVVDRFTATADRRKGWNVYRGPGTTQVSFTGIQLTSMPHTEPLDPANPNSDDVMHGLGDLDLALILTGKCPLNDGDDFCGDFPLVPLDVGEEYQLTSSAQVSTFWIHARGEKNATHEGDGCHSGEGALMIPSILEITAIICSTGTQLQENTPPPARPTCQ